MCEKENMDIRVTGYTFNLPHKLCDWFQYGLVSYSVVWFSSTYFLCLLTKQLSNNCNNCKKLNHVTLIFFGPKETKYQYENSIKSRVFTDVTQMTMCYLRKVENNMGKGENAVYQHFLLFP